MSARLHTSRATGPEGNERPAPAPPSPLAGVGSAGQGLDARTRRAMSARFGHDFSRVRIHADRRAGEAAKGIGADAYALGGDIAFGAGRYRPGSSDTERLLAHELTHVVQQDRHGAATGGVSGPADAAEREAEQVASGERVAVRAAPTAAVSRSPATGASGTVSAGTSLGVFDYARAFLDEEEEQARPYVEAVDTGEKKINEGITWGEDKEKGFTRSATDAIPALGPLAQDADDFTELVGGAGRSVTGTAGGLVKMGLNPVGTARGLGSLATHLGDPEYLKKMFVEPYREQWEQGRYYDVIGHAGGDLFTLLAGGPGMEGAGELGNAARVGEEVTVTEKAAAAAEKGGAGALDTAGARDPWAGAHEPPTGGPPRGGGGGGFSGGGPQSIPEMILQEMEKGHAGAHPLDPEQFRGLRSEPAAPPARASSPAPSRSGGGAPLDPLPPAIDPNALDSSLQILREGGTPPEELDRVARELADAQEVPGVNSCRLSPVKQAALDQLLGANRGRRH